MHNTLLCATIYLFCLQEILKGLQAKGHEIKEENLAVVQNLLNECGEKTCEADNIIKCKNTPCIFASSDGFKGGAPDGF